MLTQMQNKVMKVPKNKSVGKEETVTVFLKKNTVIAGKAYPKGMNKIPKKYLTKIANLL